jgi:peroxiredoxin
VIREEGYSERVSLSLLCATLKAFSGGYEMGRKIFCFMFAVVVFFGWAMPGWTKVLPPELDASLPDFQLPAPGNPAYGQYLGVGDKDRFRIPQIKARAVVIEIFSMYCPFCQKEAPRVNELYQKIESDKGLKGRIKMIGIGAGNSSFEVDIFRKKYGVPFPLFPDQDFLIHKCLGEPRTPYFIVVALGPESSQKVIYSRLGGIVDFDSFLKTIRSRAGIE